MMQNRDLPGGAVYQKPFTREEFLTRVADVKRRMEKAGFDPVGLVVGSSIYHIGFQAANWKASQEMGVLTQAMYSASSSFSVTILRFASATGPSARFAGP